MKKTKTGKFKTIFNQLWVENAMSLWQVEQLLDKAQAEFPIQFWMGDFHNLTDEQQSHLDCERNRQTLAWFEMWFGALNANQEMQK